MKGLIFKYIPMYYKRKRWKKNAYKVGYQTHNQELVNKCSNNLLGIDCKSPWWLKKKME